MVPPNGRNYAKRKSAKQHIHARAPSLTRLLYQKQGRLSIKIGIFCKVHIATDINNLSKGNKKIWLSLMKTAAVLPPMSYAAPEPAGIVTFDSGTEFSDAIRGKETEAVLDVMDELMGVLQTINPRLYNGVMRRLER